MLIWCCLLFVLGILAFLDSLFNYGEIFRQVNSVLFLLTSLGLLVRCTMKKRFAARERLAEDIRVVEKELKALKSDRDRKVIMANLRRSFSVGEVVREQSRFQDVSGVPQPGSRPSSQMDPRQ